MVNVIDSWSYLEVVVCSGLTIIIYNYSTTISQNFVRCLNSIYVMLCYVLKSKIKAEIIKGLIRR